MATKKTAEPARLPERSPNLVPLREAAKLLGVEPSTLASWAKKGAVPYYRCGRRYLRFDVQAILASFSVPARQDQGRGA